MGSLVQLLWTPNKDFNQVFCGDARRHEKTELGQDEVETRGPMQLNLLKL